jgi:hypothetical protein
MIEERKQIMREHIGIKVWIENGEYFYDDGKTEGGKSFCVDDEDIKEVMHQILFLAHTIECM